MKAMEKFTFISIKQRSKLPKTAGVYCFEVSKDYLYIGKANNIRDRAKNHFSQPSYRDGLFINQIKRIGYIKTDSEIEALLLEANLIKKHKPKYNVVWRDDKNYFFVGITKEDYPRVFITHQTKLKANYLGPFVDGKSLKQTLKILRKVFPYRSCLTFPKKPCLWYQLDRCPAPCILKSNLAKQIPTSPIKMKRECKRNTKNLTKILQGKKSQALKDLKKEMKQTSKDQDFEGAGRIRDQIQSLEKVMAHGKVFQEKLKEADNWKETKETLAKILNRKEEINRIEAFDISNIQGKQATGSMVTFINGNPDKSFYRKFKIRLKETPDDVAMIKEVLARRQRHKEWGQADLILIDGGRAQLNAAKEIIKNIPVMAIAKKKNELFLKNKEKPILLKTLPRDIFNLILKLRDEAHRFAISYHKALRKKALLKK